MGSVLPCFLADTAPARDARLPEGDVDLASIQLFAGPGLRKCSVRRKLRAQNTRPTGDVAKQCHVEPAVVARRRTLGCFGNTSLSIYKLSGAGVAKGLLIYKLLGPGLLSYKSTKPGVYILIIFGVLGGPRVYRSINSWCIARGVIHGLLPLLPRLQDAGHHHGPGDRAGFSSSRHGSELM